jgi:hypothetical protein
MAYGSDMVVYILRATSLDRSRANQGEGCGGGDFHNTAKA